MNKKIIIIILILIMFASSGELYKVNVDQDYGFYQVRNSDNPTSNISYEDKTLYINIGDTVEWINDADPDEKLTIDGWEIIDENTFSGLFYHTLRWNYQKYSWTFNFSGKYRIHIDEYLRVTSQTIIVKNNDEVSLKATSDFPIKIRGDGVIEESFGIQNTTIIYNNTSIINQTTEVSKQNYILFLYILFFCLIIFLIIIVHIHYKNR